jgi:hypothetical protein
MVLEVLDFVPDFVTDFVFAVAATMAKRSIRVGVVLCVALLGGAGGTWGIMAMLQSAWTRLWPWLRDTAGPWLLAKLWLVLRWAVRALVFLWLFGVLFQVMGRDTETTDLVMDWTWEQASRAWEGRHWLGQSTVALVCASPPVARLLPQWCGSPPQSHTKKSRAIIEDDIDLDDPNWFEKI